MEPQLLWDRISLLLEDFFSLSSLLSWVKAFDLMNLGSWTPCEVCFGKSVA